MVALSEVVSGLCITNWASDRPRLDAVLCSFSENPTLGKSHLVRTMKVTINPAIQIQSDVSKGPFLSFELRRNTGCCGRVVKH